MRILLGAFGDPGHAFPMIALARGLRARGHEVTLQTAERWRTDVEREGVRFAAAPEYHVFPTQERPLKPYEAVVRATGETLELVRSSAPDVVVADILTLAPALAAELEGVRVATLIPHVDPRPAAGFAPYSLGARLPRTGARARVVVALRPADRPRARAGAARAGRDAPAPRPPPVGPRARRDLARPRPRRRPSRSSSTRGRWRSRARTSSARCCGSRSSATCELPGGDGPLVLVAPVDRAGRAAPAAARGARGARGRSRACACSRPGTAARSTPPTARGRVAPNTRLVEWVSYARTMPRCDVVVCHGGHGTLVRALASGCAGRRARPRPGDMNENAARVDWAGAGVRIPRRLVGAGDRCGWRSSGRSGSRGIRARARELAAWLERHDPPARAAELVERLGAAA